MLLQPSQPVKGDNESAARKVDLASSGWIATKVSTWIANRTRLSGVGISCVTALSVCQLPAATIDQPSGNSYSPNTRIRPKRLGTIGNIKGPLVCGPFRFPVETKKLTPSEQSYCSRSFCFPDSKRFANLRSVIR
jgi:hypothetical protein